jgi:thymidylate synthase
MKQYLDLARAVKEKGTYKAPAREGMPGTTSLFGYQFRHDLSEGFPLLTTKKLSFKNIVVELLWFLRGDTNIKYLVDNGCNIWNEDAYNYYCKVATEKAGFENSEIFHPISVDDWDKTPLFGTAGGFRLHSYGEFTNLIRKGEISSIPGYTLGDCGKQYGWLWRNWGGDTNSLEQVFMIDVNNIPPGTLLDNTEESLLQLRKLCKESGILPIDSSSKPKKGIDQIKDLIDGLKNSPMSRRHILTTWNPATLNDMALNACHALVQFNCRPLSYDERNAIFKETYGETVEEMDARWEMSLTTTFEQDLDNSNIPKYKLDCQMYQRSADLFLGVPYNIASYALLTHILCKICNMIPGDFIHSFGDVHIYDNHMTQIDEQLTREPKPLPTLVCLERNEKGFLPDNLDKYLSGRYDLNDFINSLDIREFRLNGYDSHPAIKGELSTGLKK